MKTRIVLFRLLVAAVAVQITCAAAQKQADAEAPDFEKALGCLRTLNTAAATYVSTYDKGYSATIAAMGMAPGWTTPTLEAAGLIDEKLSTGKMAGYVFDYKPGAKDKTGWIGAYSITARPLKWKKSVVSYFTDQTGVIRWTRANRTPTAKDPPIDTLFQSLRH